jgi:hypothetical protein
VVQNSENLNQQLLAVVNGEFGSLRSVAAARQATLLAAQKDIGSELIVGRRQVLLVLNSLLSGRVTFSEAQLWAGFVLRGYFPSPYSSVPVKPLQIALEPEYEQELVDALARLSEYGDLIDGKIDTDEIRRMAEGLGRL